VAALFPFRALRPTPAAASDVAAVPYDVVTRDEAASIAHGNPLSFLHVSRAEIDVAAGTDPYADEVYDKAARNFLELQAAAPLVTLSPVKRRRCTTARWTWSAAWHNRRPRRGMPGRA